jgi:SagB-type dehydrogenase family enzyme
MAEGDRDLLAFLAPLGLLDDADDSPSLVMWEPLDLLFATRIAWDFAPEHIGASFRFREIFGPTGYEQSAEFPGDTVSLPAPPPLPAVDFGVLVDQRRSIRNFIDEPVPIDLLSSLLWHTMRVTRFQPLNPDIQDAYDTAFKPVASSGAVAAIDAWVVARDVRGLESGTWWYNPLTHQLHRTSHSTIALDVEQVPTLNGEQAPQISIILASRHERLAWKYERLALTSALRDSGVLIHALQLTATALGLGTVPLGASANRELIEVMATDQYRRMPIAQVWVGNPAPVLML